MAYDKIITLRGRMDHCLDYVLNEEKTGLADALAYVENPAKTHQLVTGINCEVDTALSDMRATKKRWDKKGGVLGYHIIHSYAPGEVTPDEAHAAGVEFASVCWGTNTKLLWRPMLIGSICTVTSFSIPFPLWMEKSTAATFKVILETCAARPTK